MSLGVLYQAGMPLPMLLDAVAHAETGHLSGPERYTATSRKGARGMYQFMPGNLHDMGYRMPQNIPLSDVLDPTKARDLAGQYITGYSDYHGMTSPLEQLVAYNLGPTKASAWMASGGDVNQLPKETQDYIKRAAAFLNAENTAATNTAASTTGDQPMNNQQPTTFLGMPFDQEQAIVLQEMAANGNKMAQLALKQMENLPGSNSSSPALTYPSLPSDIDANGSGILTTSANAADTFTTVDPNAPPPVLTDNDIAAASNPETGALSGPVQEGGPIRIGIQPSSEYMVNRQQPPTNRRDQSPMSMAAPRIGNINDLLIRMGSAGARGAATSGLESFAAMGDAYTDYYKDQNDMVAKYNAALAKGTKGKKGSGTGAENLPYATAALDAINTIEKYVNDQGSSFWPFNDVTGPIGAALSYVPGTPSHNVAMQIDTIEAAIGFDRLQAMRDASPTGGALGQVSEMELTLLKSSLGSLRQSQTQVEFMRNLKKVQKHYQGAVDAINRQTNAYQTGNYSQQQSSTGAVSGSAVNNMSVGSTQTINGVSVTRVN